MAVEQYYARDWRSVSAASADSENLNGNFECNICFDSARDPVVTLCGHLYCWPCVYKWSYVQSASLASDEHPQCPVCKAEISHTTLVPLYGRGQTPNEAELEGKRHCRGMAIPPRPPACGTQALINASSHNAQQLQYRNPYQNQLYDRNRVYEREPRPSLFNMGGSTATSFFHPVVGMFGEMFYARVFGNSESLYAYPNSYNLMGSSNPRLRRQEKSLNRISVFLFCVLHCSKSCFGASLLRILYTFVKAFHELQAHINPNHALKAWGSSLLDDI